MVDTWGSGEPERARELFDELSRKLSPRARRYIRMRLGASLRRRVDSEDVLQEVLLEASQAFLEGEKLPLDEKEFYLKLKAIVEKKIKSLVRFHIEAGKRSVKREVPLPAEGGGVVDPSGGKTPSSVLLARERADRIELALQKLSPRQRQVIDLVVFQRLRVAEAAEQMGKTAGSTSVLLCQALKRLGRFLRKKED